MFFRVRIGVGAQSGQRADPLRSFATKDTTRFVLRVTQRQDIPTRSWNDTAGLVQVQLRAAGFTVLGTETVTHTGTLEEKRAWLSIPAFARPPGPLTYEQRMEILERACARADASRPVTTAWLVVTAEA